MSHRMMTMIAPSTRCSGSQHKLPRADEGNTGNGANIELALCSLLFAATARVNLFDKGLPQVSE